MRAMSIAATGMLAQQLNVEVISNNIANATTTGFKRQRADFQDLLYQTLQRPGVESSDTGTLVPAGIQLGAGVSVGNVYRIHEQGNIEITNSELDMAINGEGFFQIQLPSGDTAYTRAGSFQLSANGELVTPEGYLAIPQITVPQQVVDITVSASGQVSAKIDGQVQPVVLGQLELATFPNNAGLEALGDNLFLETPASGAVVTGQAGQPGFGRILQGRLETSNTDIVTEITKLITAQRAYEMNSKVITTADAMLATVGDIR